MTPYFEGQAHGSAGGGQNGNPYRKGWADDPAKNLWAEQWDAGWLDGRQYYLDALHDKRTADCQETLDDEFGR